MIVTVIRDIPDDAVCPKCEKGWMTLGSMKGKQKREGRHHRRAQCVCDRCGHSESRWFLYRGIKEEIVIETEQSLLFSESTPEAIETEHV